MGTGADSVKAYSAVLHKKPNDAEALAALEALLKDDSVRAEAARALIPAYEAVKEHRKLVAALDLVAEMTQDQLERVLALQQAAHVHLHHLRQPELAFAALSRALRLSPADPNLRTAARRAAEDADAMDGFANVLKELVARGDLESGARVALHRDLADVQERKLDDRRGAIAQLESVLVIDPGNVDALRGLQRLLRATEDWRRLVSVLDSLATAVPDPAEKTALWREMALLREGKLEDREAAASAWRRVSEADPLNREAVSALDRLYTTLGKFENLAFALELRRAQEGQSPQGREATFRLAQLRRERASGLRRRAPAPRPGALRGSRPHPHPRPARRLGPLARPGEPQRAGHAGPVPRPLRPARPPGGHPRGADRRCAHRREDPPHPGDPLHPGAGHGPAASAPSSPPARPSPRTWTAPAPRPTSSASPG